MIYLFILNEQWSKWMILLLGSFLEGGGFSSAFLSSVPQMQVTLLFHSAGNQKAPESLMMMMEVAFWVFLDPGTSSLRTISWDKNKVWATGFRWSGGKSSWLRCQWTEKTICNECVHYLTLWDAGGMVGFHQSQCHLRVTWLSSRRSGGPKVIRWPTAVAAPPYGVGL